VEWHLGELADVPSFTVLKTQICVTRPQCVKLSCNASQMFTWKYYEKHENTAWVIC